MSLPQSHKRLAASGAISLIIKGAGAVLSYAMVVAFARLLSANQYGAFAFGLNAAIILSTVIGLGFSTGILRYWPKYVAAADHASALGVMNLGYRLTLLCGAGLLILALLIAFTLNLPDWAGTPSLMLATAALSVAVALGDYSTNLLRAQGSIITSMLPRDVFWRVFTPGIAFLAMSYGLQLSASRSLLIATVVLLALVAWQALRAHQIASENFQNTKPRVDFAAIRQSLMPLWVSSVVFALIQQFDVVIVGSMLSKAEAGSYFAAQKTAQLLSLILIAGGLVTAPSMAALYHSGRRAELQALCHKLASVIAVATLLGFIALALLGKFMLALFDPSFVAAYPILIMLGIGTVIDAMSGPNAYLMQMTSYESSYMKIMLSCYALVLVAQVVLIPHFGAQGAALASAGGVILWNLSAIFVLRRKAGLDPSLLALIAPPRQDE